jgi:uncharacterized membrane protein YqjE
VRVLWSLPKAAPVLLRHIAAYVELAALDFATAQREITARLVASAIIVICVILAVLMGCLAVVAYTWDTPHRLVAIAWMGGGFLGVAVVALLYRSNRVRGESPFLSTVRREWLEDRVILERILSSDQD